MLLLQVDAIEVSKKATIEADLEEQMGPLSVAPSAGKALLALGESGASTSEFTWRQLAVLQIEDVFLSQLHYRSRLLNSGFQGAVMQVCFVYVHAGGWFGGICLRVATT